MRRTITKNAVALFAAGVCWMACPALADRSDWRELTVGHFHLYSTVSDSKTRDFAARLQGFEQTAVQVLHTDAKLPDLPI